MWVLFRIEELGVEAVVVLLVLEVQLHWRDDLLSHQLIDIQTLEEGMSQDLLRITIRAQSLRLVFVEETLDDIRKVVRIIDLVLGFVGKHDLALFDLQEEQLALAIVEWSHTNEHLVDKDAKCPPVD